MNCHSCGSLLKPTGNSNYSFYRVSNFYCDNAHCKNPDKDVYISHCANGYCDGIIDIRYSAKCDNNWIICNECFACCDKERLDKRNNTQQINGQNITQWKTPAGHRGYYILCPKCANPMQFKISAEKKQEYDDVIAKFERLASLNMPDNKKWVGKHGINNGKKWFVIYQRNANKDKFINRLYDLQGLGFNIVDFDDKTKSHYLIVEPSDEKHLFYCQSCKSHYNYTSEYDKYRAVKYWHSS